MPSTQIKISNTPKNVAPSSAADIIRLSCAESLRALNKYRAAVLRLEEEPIHQMRVGTRKLRAILTTFGNLMDEQWSNELVTELRWLAHSLGAVRDYDILHKRLRAATSTHDRQVLGKLHRILAKRHREAQKALLESLKSDRYQYLIERLRVGSIFPATSLEANEPPRIALLPLLSAAWQKLARAANNLKQSDAPAKFHRVRKMAKRFRYSTEAIITNFDSIGSENAAEFIQRIKQLQDILGEHQDAIVAAQTVANIIEMNMPAANQPNTPSRFEEAAQRLVDNQSKAAKKARKDFKKIWKKASDPKFRKWMKAGPGIALHT